MTRTPGPWFVLNVWRQKDPSGMLVGPEEYPVCAMTGYHGLEKTSANAQLIAAAPALYEALKAVLAWDDMDWLSDEKLAQRHTEEPGNGYGSLIMARAAIALAEGRAS